MSGVSAPGARLLRWSILALGFAFLYVPIVVLIVYSFNESRLASVWSGFSFKWYGELLRDQSMLDAAWVSLRVAFWTATASMVIGTMAALAMTRMRQFPTKTAFGAMITAPLVMPEVITGLSILLMLVSVAGSVGIAPKGVVSIWIAHVTFTLSFVTVVVSSRLAELDKSLEEAAMDLGARPAQVFWLVTLPMISQSLVSAWLLTFTISLDDVVISNFLSGPGSTTMPLVIFSRARLGLSPSVNVVAAITVAVVSAGILVASWLIARAERQRALDLAAAARA